MRIVVVENDEGFRNQWVEFLREHENTVIPLPGLSGQTARDLHKEHFDLALIDRRCRDDKNRNDKTGEDFAVELCSLGTPTVLVTAFLPDDTALFDLLRTGAVSGIADKSVDMGEVAMCVEEFGVSHRFPNCVAKFSWKGRIAEHFGAKDWLEVGKPVEGAFAPEQFAVLFRSLIPPCARQVELQPIPPGHGGAALFHAHVWSGDGPVSEEVAIKYGERAAIRSEAMNYDRHVGPLPDGVAAHLRWRKETRALGALAYSWVGDSVEDGMPFASVHSSSPTLSWRRRRNALERLFSVSLDPWYKVYRRAANDLETSPTLLDYYIGVNKSAFVASEDLLLSLTSYVRSEGKQWDFGEYGKWINPLIWLETSAISQDRLARYCPCHGDLHVKNIFILPDDSPRLIDFGDTALGHVFRDFTALEASIRLTCCNTTDLKALKVCTDCISNVRNLGEHIDYRSPSENFSDLREVLKTIMLIRRAALDAVGNHPADSSLKEYLFALVIRMLRYARGIADEVSPHETQEQRNARKWHALYAAARAAQQVFELGGVQICDSVGDPTTNRKAAQVAASS